MDEQEKSKLKKTYEEMAEGQLIEVILEDEKEYKKQPYEAYELLLEEAKKRGIEDKIMKSEEKKEGCKLKKSKKNKEIEKLKDSKLVAVKAFPYRHGAEFAKGILAETGIESIITTNDCCSYRRHLRIMGLGAELLVRDEDVEKAREALRLAEDNKK